MNASSSLRAQGVLILFLIFYLGVAPIGKNVVLLPLLGLCGLAGGLRMLTTSGPGERIRQRVLFFAVAGAFPVAVGAIEGTAGWVDVMIPLVFGPISWFGISFLLSPAALEKVPLSIALSAIGVSVTIFGTIFGFSVPILSDIQSTAKSSSTRVSLTGATALVVSIPFLVAYLIETIDNPKLKWRKLCGFALVAALFSAAVTGRQSILGAVFLAPILIWLVRRPRAMGAPSGLRKSLGASMGRYFEYGLLGAGSACVAAVLLAAFGRDVGRMVGDFSSSLGLSEARTQRVEFSYTSRSKQHVSLSRDWVQSPIWGHGAGKIHPESAAWRDHLAWVKISEHPWRTELQYHLLLYEGGLLGVLLYVGAARSAFVALRRNVSLMSSSHAALLRASLVACLALAVATASNPYVRGVGQQWALFFPIAIAATAVNAQAKVPSPQPPATRLMQTPSGASSPRELR